MKYDDMIESVGGFGRYQKFFYFLTFITSIPNGLITMMFVFIHYLPDHHCKIHGLTNLSDIEQERLLNFTIPWVKNEDGQLQRSGCKRYNFSNEEFIQLYHGGYNYSSDQFIVNRSTVQCDGQWMYKLEPGFQSVVTEFDLICGDSWKPPLAVSLYMVGMGIGACSGILADRFGRRKLFLWSTFIQFLAAGTSGFSWNFPSYAILMFFTGMMGLVNFIVAFIMNAEIMDVKHRNTMGLGPFIAYSLGYLLSPIAGYLLQDWRWYMWANGLIGIFFIPYYWLISESPRWLIARGEIGRAKLALKNIAKTNKTEVDVDALFKDGVELEKALVEETNKRESNFLYVFCSRSMLGRIIAVYFAWFVTSLIYFGLSLNTSNLSGNRFVNCSISALAEGPGYILSWFMLKRIGRPRTLFICMAASGISCSIVPLLQLSGYKSVVVAVAMFGKGTISAMFYTVYVSVAEVSPTLVRNFSGGTASAFARLGGLLGPYLLYAGEQVHSSIPYVVMGILAISSSILGIVFIPETRGITLPENKADAENNNRFYGIKLWKSPANCQERRQEGGSNSETEI